jgi:hypothetical protein
MLDDIYKKTSPTLFFRVLGFFSVNVRRSCLLGLGGAAAGRNKHNDGFTLSLLLQSTADSDDLKMNMDGMKMDDDKMGGSHVLRYALFI